MALGLVVLRPQGHPRLYGLDVGIGEIWSAKGHAGQAKPLNSLHQLAVSRISWDNHGALITASHHFFVTGEGKLIRWIDVSMAPDAVGVEDGLHLQRIAHEDLFAHDQGQVHYVVGCVCDFIAQSSCSQAGGWRCHRGCAVSAGPQQGCQQQRRSPTVTPNRRAQQFDWDKFRILIFLSFLCLALRFHIAPLQPKYFVYHSK